MVYNKKDYEYTIEELIAIAKEARGFSSPQFQLYTGDFLSSPRILLMPWGAPQAFFFLLLFEWEAPDCSLPNDEDALKVFSRANEHWPEVRESVLAMFTEVDGKLYNRRLLLERKKQIARRKVCSIAGKKSGEARKKAPSRRVNKRSTKHKHINDNDNDKSLKPISNTVGNIVADTSSGLAVMETVRKPDHILLYEYWNSTDGLVKTAEMFGSMVAVAKKAVADYPLADLKKSIRNYAMVVQSPLTRYTFKHTFEHFFSCESDGSAPYKTFFSECEPHKFFLLEDTGKTLDREFLRAELRDALSAIEGANPELNLETMLGRVNAQFSNSWESWRYIVENLSVKQLKDILEHLTSYRGDSNGV